MKYQCELIIHEQPDGRIFLNYWDYKGGEDVCCEIINGSLFRSMHNENGDDLPKEEIILMDFIEAVSKL